MCGKAVGKSKNKEGYLFRISNHNNDDKLFSFSNKYILRTSNFLKLVIVLINYLLAHKGIHITQHPSERNDINWVHFARKTEGKL